MFRRIFGFLKRRADELRGKDDYDASRDLTRKEKEFEEYDQRMNQNN